MASGVFYSSGYSLSSMEFSTPATHVPSRSPHQPEPRRERRPSQNHSNVITFSSSYCTPYSRVNIHNLNILRRQLDFLLYISPLVDTR